MFVLLLSYLRLYWCLCIYVFRKSLLLGLLVLAWPFMAAPGDGLGSLLMFYSEFPMVPEFVVLRCPFALLNIHLQSP